MADIRSDMRVLTELQYCRGVFWLDSSDLRKFCEERKCKLFHNGQRIDLETVLGPDFDPYDKDLDIPIMLSGRGVHLILPKPEKIDDDFANAKLAWQALQQ